MNIIMSKYLCVAWPCLGHFSQRYVDLYKIHKTSFATEYVNKVKKPSNRRRLLYNLYIFINKNCIIIVMYN